MWVKTSTPPPLRWPWKWVTWSLLQAYSSLAAPPTSRSPIRATKATGMGFTEIFRSVHRCEGKMWLSKLSIVLVGLLIWSTQARYPENFMLISQLEVHQEGGVKKGGTWRKLRVPDRRHGGHGYSWCHELCFFTLRKIPWKFCVDIFTGSVSGIGGQEGGDLEAIEGSWQETWRTGWSLMLWMTFFDPKDHILKVSVCYPHVLLSYKWFKSKWPTSVVRLG